MEFIEAIKSVAEHVRAWCTQTFATKKDVAINETEFDNMLNEEMPILPTFSVADDGGRIKNTYCFEEGMVWGDFINSKYNPLPDEDGHFWVSDSSTVVYHTTVDENGNRYSNYVGETEFSEVSVLGTIKANAVYVAWT